MALGVCFSPHFSGAKLLPWRGETRSAGFAFLRFPRRKPAPRRGRSAGAHFDWPKRTKSHLGRSPLRTSLGYETGPASRRYSARHPCCGPCLCHHTRRPWAAGPIAGRFPPPGLPSRSGVPAAGGLVISDCQTRSLPQGDVAEHCWFLALLGVGEGLAPPEFPRALPGCPRAGQATAPTTASQRDIHALDGGNASMKPVSLSVSASSGPLGPQWPGSGHILPSLRPWQISHRLSS